MFVHKSDGTFYSLAKINKLYVVGECQFEEEIMKFGLCYAYILVQQSLYPVNAQGSTNFCGKVALQEGVEKLKTRIMCQI